MLLINNKITYYILHSNITFETLKEFKKSDGIGIIRVIE